MTTAGQALLDKSSAASGSTAADHLLSTITGVGGGDVFISGRSSTVARSASASVSRSASAASVASNVTVRQSRVISARSVQ
jgi:hypothetical protein